MVEGIKDFILERLSAHNCEADSDALADYIIALVENGVKEPEDFSEHLQVFLYDSTESFIKELLQFMESKGDIEHFVDHNDAKDISEVEVDYEESSSNEVVSTQPPLPHVSIQRPLREYSPERRPESTSEKRPCSNFSRYGTCRFGDGCRYSHIPTNNLNRRRQVSTQVKLSNLPTLALNPASLNEIMSKFGSVTNVTVYPEMGEASVQFVKGEEALAAIEGVVNEFESEGVTAELELIKPLNQQHQHQQRHQPKVLKPDESKLNFLLNLQTQQQSLLETNLSTQTTLLTSLQSSPTEDLLATLKRVQESGKGIEGILKKTGDMIEKLMAGDDDSRGNDYFDKKQQSSYRPSFRPQFQARPPYNTARPPYNTAKPPYNTTRPLYNNVKSSKWPPQPVNMNNTYRPNSTATSYGGRPQSSNSLDLRPTTLKLSPLPSTNLTDIHALQRHFSPYGPIQSLIIGDAGKSALIKYQKHGDAQKAFEVVGKEFEGVEGVEFDFIKQ